MDTLLAIDYLALAVGWIVGSYLVGITAGNRGFSPMVWGLFSLVASPLVGMVLLALVTRRDGPRIRR